ncbi:MAG TPA: hypothetical protein VD926_01485 [Acidimicrobiales bacterium]|nr:hypothetical protein [Acidimicrobiales bacterium]
MLASLVVLASACGGDDPGIDPRASRELEEQVDLIEFAISAQRYDAARDGLQNVRAEVEGHVARGDISDERARAISASLNRLDEALAAVG